MRVHAAVSLIGVGVLLAGGSLLDLSVWWIQALVIGLFYAVIFGGTHAYFVVRGGGGDVPSTARKRFLALLAPMVVLLPLAVVVGTRRVDSLLFRTVLTVLILGLLGWYLLAEGRAGYRATMDED